MSRLRRELDPHGNQQEVLNLLRKTPAGWKRERLLAIKLGLEKEMGMEQIARQLGRAHQSIVNWFNLFRQGGVSLLLSKGHSSGRPLALDPQQMALFKAELEKNQWRTGVEAYQWLQKSFGVTFHPQRIYPYLKKVGGRMKVPRPSHKKKTRNKALTFGKP